MKIFIAISCSLAMVAGIHGAKATSTRFDRNLIQLVSGDGLDRDAAATGNDRTGASGQVVTEHRAGADRVAAGPMGHAGGVVTTIAFVTAGGDGEALSGRPDPAGHLVEAKTP